MMQTLLSKGFGWILLCLLLILGGAVFALNLTFTSRDLIMGVAAIFAGILLLAGK